MWPLPLSKPNGIPAAGGGISDRMEFFGGTGIVRSYFQYSGRPDPVSCGEAAISK